jgi:BASS family bile acid:Na+ symporter
MNTAIASVFSSPGTLISVLLGVVMFGMGLATKVEDFKVVFRRPLDIAIGCAAQFTIMPTLAWALSRLFGLDEALTVGVVLVGCCPGGTASNVITYLAKGDLALSVGMTGVSTILAPFLTPALTLLIAGKTVDVDASGMFVGILWVVILPILLGFAAKRFFPKATEKAVRFMPTVSSVAIAIIIMLILAVNAKRLFTGGLTVFIVVVLHNVCGLALGYMLAAALRLAEPKRRALCIEVGMQNSGLAASLAAVHFAAYPMAAVPGAIFSVWHNMSGAFLARCFRLKNR